MNLRTKIEEQYKTAFKLKNTEEVNTLRLIRSAIMDKDIENRSASNKNLINDQQILLVLQSLVKQRKDSIESFKIALRDDLVKKEVKEIEIIKKFLPEQLSKDEIRTIINQFVAKNNISSIKEMGKIIGYLKLNYAASIDMRLAGKIAQEILEK